MTDLYPFIPVIVGPATIGAILVMGVEIETFKLKVIGLSALFTSIFFVGTKDRYYETLDKCPGVSIDMVRKIFKEKQKTGEIVCIGRGRDAKWRRNI